MDQRISLYVLGLSYSQLQSGAYALVLAEENGPRRIPVVIGASEAQSIAIALEGIRTPRPLTHELFVSFAHAFGVKLKEVFIYRFEDGVFSSEITFSDGDRTVVIDSRTSDAIAIAMRTQTPIYTTEEIMQTAGFVIADEEIRAEDDTDADTEETEAHHSQSQQQADGTNGSPQVLKARQHQAKTETYGIRPQDQRRQMEAFSIPCLLHGPPLSVSNSFRC